VPQPLLRHRYYRIFAPNPAALPAAGRYFLTAPPEHHQESGTFGRLGHRILRVGLTANGKMDGMATLASGVEPAHAEGSDG